MKMVFVFILLGIFFGISFLVFVPKEDLSESELDLSIGTLAKAEIISNTITRTNNKLIIDFDKKETTNFTFYAKNGDTKITVPHSKVQEDIDSFGFAIDEDNVRTTLALASVDWDKKLYYSIESDKEYFLSENNPYVLERVLTIQDTTDKDSFPCSFNDQLLCAFIENDIGIPIEKQVKRFLSFEEIPKKEQNRFNTTVKEINRTICSKGIDNITDECVDNLTSIIPVNISVKTERDIRFVMYKEKGNWIIETTNIFDLDPSFIDDTDSNFNDGSFVNMEVQGVGTKANLTSSARNTSGSFGSKVFNANSTVNMTNISCSVEYPYGTELGRANADNNDASLEDIFINTSGLVLLMHFNNESNFGEDDDLFVDFSTRVNSDRINSIKNNGTCTGTECPLYDVGNRILGEYGILFDGSDDIIEIPVDPSLDFGLNDPLTFMAWIKINTFGNGDRVLGKFVGGDISPGIFLEGTDTFRFFWDGAGFNDFGIISSAGSVGDSEWHHIAVTSDMSGVVAGTTIYLDGAVDIPSSTDDSGDTPIDSSGTDFAIGNRGSDNGRPFDGYMDEVMVFDRTLSADEIKNIYMRGAIRLNISARGCNDDACDGETFELANSSVLGGTYPLNFSSEFQHIQWNATFSSNASTPLTDRPVINNCTIEFLETAAPAVDTCSPTSPLTGDHTYLGSDDCIITTDLDAAENDIICQGAGTLTIKAVLLNVRNFFTTECNTFCYNTPECFG